MQIMIRYAAFQKAQQQGMSNWYYVSLCFFFVASNGRFENDANALQHKEFFCYSSLHQVEFRNAR